MNEMLFPAKDLFIYSLNKSISLYSFCKIFLKLTLIKDCLSAIFGNLSLGAKNLTELTYKIYQLKLKLTYFFQNKISLLCCRIIITS